MEEERRLVSQWSVADVASYIKDADDGENFMEVMFSLGMLAEK